MIRNIVIFKNIGRENNENNTQLTTCCMIQLFLFYIQMIIIFLLCTNNLIFYTINNSYDTLNVVLFIFDGIERLDL